MIDREDLEEFGQIKGVPSKASPTPLTPFSKVQEKCKEMSDLMLREVMYKNIKNLLQLVSKNYQDKLYKAQIYPIILKENQVQHLPMYLEALTSALEKKSQQIFHMNEDDIHIKIAEGTDVRDITLNIYSDSEEMEGVPDFQLYVYIIKEVTDLSQSNMYVFSKGITNKKFVAFVPTFQTFDDDNYEGIQILKYEKYLSSIYESKSLFCEYFYECIMNPEIKAFVPPETIRIITDMDYYSIGYGESCRRLDYVIEKTRYLNAKEHPDIDTKSISELIKLIETIIEKKFRYYQYKTNLHKIIRIICNEKQHYIIPERAIKTEIQFTVHNKEKPESISEDGLISIFKASLAKRLPSPYAQIIKEEEEVEIKQRGKKKKNREEQLGLCQRHLSLKIRLENSITRVIKIATKDIRIFGESIKWKNILFEQRLVPSIPFKIVSSMKEEEEVEGLVDEVTSHYVKPLSSLLSLFPEEQIGYGLYLIKTLELSGLFSLSKREINPLTYNNYFQKTRFDRTANKHK